MPEIINSLFGRSKNEPVDSGPDVATTDTPPADSPQSGGADAVVTDETGGTNAIEVKPTESTTPEPAADAVTTEDVVEDLETAPAADDVVESTETEATEAESTDLGPAGSDDSSSDDSGSHDGDSDNNDAADADLDATGSDSDSESGDATDSSDTAGLGDPTDASATADSDDTAVSSDTADLSDSADLTDAADTTAFPADNAADSDDAADSGDATDLGDPAASDDTAGSADAADQAGDDEPLAEAAIETPVDESPEAAKDEDLTPEAATEVTAPADDTEPASTETETETAAETAPVATETDAANASDADDDADQPEPVVAPVAADTRPTAGTRGNMTVGDGVGMKVVNIVVSKIDGVHSLDDGGIAVDVHDDVATIKVSFVAEYGHPIKALAEQIRTDVIEAVEQFLGLDVAAVDVHVSDIHLPTTG